MKPLSMQHFMSNRPFGEVSVGRRKQLNTSGVDDDCKFALTSSPAFILVGIEYYIDFNARAFLHFKDELLDRPAKTGKILRLHMPKMLDI